MNRPTPLDPNSAKGREVAARLSQVLAEILVEIRAEERSASRRRRTAASDAA